MLSNSAQKAHKKCKMQNDRSNQLRWHCETMPPKNLFGKIKKDSPSSLCHLVQPSYSPGSLAFPLVQPPYSSRSPPSFRVWLDSLLWREVGRWQLQAQFSRLTNPISRSETWLYKFSNFGYLRLRACHFRSLTSFLLASSSMFAAFGYIFELITWAFKDTIWAMAAILYQFVWARSLSGRLYWTL